MMTVNTLFFAGRGTLAWPLLWIFNGFFLDPAASFEITRPMDVNCNVDAVNASFVCIIDRSRRHTAP